MLYVYNWTDKVNWTQYQFSKFYVLKILKFISQIAFSHVILPKLP